MSRSFSDIRSSGSFGLAQRAGVSSQLAGSRRVVLDAWMHSSSSFTSRSPTPDLRQWTLAPPRSSIEMSSPVTAFVRWGPASAIAPWPTTIGTKSERPGMYAVPAAHGPSIAATIGITPDITTSSRKRWPEPANSDPAASWIRAPAESSSQMNGIRFVQRHLAQAADLDLAGHPHRAGHHREVVGGDAAAAASTSPQPVITPSAGASLPSMARCEKWGRPWIPISTKVPGSQSRSIRSLAVSLPRSCC